MPASFSIGDFSRATHLSIKTLRHYHGVGLLEPADVNHLFAHERGEATVFVPCNASFRPSGRVEPFVIPAVELAITVHTGAHADADRTYGALAAYVADHALAVDGPIREYYLTSSRDTSGPAQWQTEIGWPIFHIGAAP